MATAEEKSRLDERRHARLRQKQMEHQRDGLLDRAGFDVVATIGRVEFTADDTDDTPTVAAFRVIGEYSAGIEKPVTVRFPNQWGGITVVSVTHDNPVNEEPDHSQAV